MSDKDSDFWVACTLCGKKYMYNDGHTCDIGDRPFAKISHRQWLAGMAMQGYISYGAMKALRINEVAELAYRHADAMIKHEKKEAKK